MKKPEYPVIACHIVVGLPSGQKSDVERDVLEHVAQEADVAFLCEEALLAGVFSGLRSIKTKAQVASFMKMMLLDCLTHRTPAVMSGVYGTTREREGLVSIINGYQELAICHFVPYHPIVESEVLIEVPTEDEGWDRIVKYLEERR